MLEDSETERVVIHAPKGTMLALERAAISAHLRPSELARLFLLEGLSANGFVFSDEPATAALWQGG